MGAPKGSKNAKGNKGGGRKSAYEEFLQAQWHYEKWTVAETVSALEDRVKKGKYSVRDIYLLRALKGDPRILAKFGDKLMPDLTVLMGPGGGAIPIDGKIEITNPVAARLARSKAARSAKPADGKPGLVGKAP